MNYHFKKLFYLSLLFLTYFVTCSPDPLKYDIFTLGESKTTVISKIKLKYPNYNISYNHDDGLGGKNNTISVDLDKSSAIIFMFDIDDKLIKIFDMKGILNISDYQKLYDELKEKHGNPYNEKMINTNRISAIWTFGNIAYTIVLNYERDTGATISYDDHILYENYINTLKKRKQFLLNE